MKTYNVKHCINQEVYILNNKSILKTKIEKIRITEQEPYNHPNGSPEQIEDGKTGISIEYLVFIESKPVDINININSAVKIVFDWYKQRDVFAERDELISKIK